MAYQQEKYQVVNREQPAVITRITLFDNESEGLKGYNLCYGNIVGSRAEAVLLQDVKRGIT
jgi:hypothetical protein